MRACQDDGAVKVLKAKLAPNRGLDKKVKTKKLGKIFIFILYVLTLYLDCDWFSRAHAHTRTIYIGFSHEKWKYIWCLILKSSYGASNSR